MPGVIQVMCTRRRVVAVWIFTALILAAVSVHFFATVTYFYPDFSPDDPDSLPSSETNTTVDVDESPICYVLPAHHWFFAHVWYWIDFSLLAAVPFVVVLTGNCVMITCVVQAVRFRYRQEPLSVSSGAARSAGGSGGSATAAEKGKAITSSTVMLMTLSIAFLLTTSPNVIYFLKVDDWIAASEDDPHFEAKLRLGFAVTNLLYYVNNAANFFLYCVAGSRFRRAMYQMFSCRRAQEGLSARAVGGDQITPSRKKTDNQQQRTFREPLDDADSAEPAAQARCITISTNMNTSV